MAIIIEEISFNNFYNFYGSYKINKYELKQGLNLIIADNGAGKSKFFNGLSWIIADNVFDSDKKKYTPIKEAKFLLISDKAKVEAELNSSITAGVKLKYKDTHMGTVFEIIKEVSATKISEGSPTESRNWTVSTNELIVNKSSTITFQPVYDEDEKKQIIRGLIGLGFRKYSLLQGEEIDKIVDLYDSDNLTSTVKTLTNISRIEELKEIIQYVASRAEKDLDNEMKTKNKNNVSLNSKIREKEDKKDKLNKILNQIKPLSESLVKEEKEKEKVLSKFANAKKRQEYRDKVDNLKRESKKIKDSEDDFINEINSKLFRKEHLWLLAGTKRYSDEFINLREEYLTKRMDIITDKKAEKLVRTKLPVDSPDNTSLERMLKEEICYVCDREAKKNSSEWLHIESVLKSHKEDQISENEIFNNDFKLLVDRFFSNNSSINLIIGEVRENIAQAFKQIEAYRTRKIDIDKQKELALEELSEYGGITDEEQSQGDVNTVNEYTNILNRINDYDNRIAQLKKTAAGYETEIGILENEISKFNQINLNDAFRKNLNVANTLKDAITKAKEKIFENIITLLETEANKHFRNLTQYSDVSGGILKFERTKTNTISLASTDKHGNIIYQLSEGFQRMRKIAVILAIFTANKRIKFIYPFIADAPLSSFGRGFIKGFFEEFCSENFPFGQSIILVKELYNRESKSKLTDLGETLLKNPNLGSMYINEIERGLPQTERTTKIQKYK